MDTLIVAVRVVVSLGVVLGVLWYLHRRISRSRVRSAGEALAVVGRQAVGQKSSVVIVEMDGRRFLLGVTEQAINVLHSDGDSRELAGVLTAAAAEVGEPDVAAAHAPDARFAQAMSEAAPVIPSAPRHSAAPAPQHPTRREVHRTDQRRRAESGLAEVAFLDPRRRQAPQPTGVLGNSILSANTWRQAAVALRRAR